MSSINWKKFNLPTITKVVLAFNIVLTVSVFYLTKAAAKVLEGSGKPDVDYSVLSVPFFQLIPSTALSHPWTFVVSSFLESTVTGLTFNVANTIIAVRYFERVWGYKEIVKFLLILSTLTNLLTAVALILFNIGSDPKPINTSASGAFSLITGFAVAFKQIVPEHNLIFFKGTFHLRVKHVPFISLVILLLVSVLTKSYYPALTSYISFFVAWVYLRFFQSMILEPLIPLSSSLAEQSASSNTAVADDPQPFGVQRVKGDASDTFAFAYFFPDIVHPILSPAFDAVYKLLAPAGLIPTFNEEDVAQSNERAVRRSAARGNTRAGGSSNIAERRRQVALKVLEERIGGN